MITRGRGREGDYLDFFSFLACRFSFRECAACFLVDFPPLSLFAMFGASIERRTGLYAMAPG
ncbi:MAG: hypothetical protein A2Z12_02965 [Actinobacteria bacterium RBG_16_68_21]|nr:MAG: hypothetical protein A2Z12_02965 [Actinobacteria bacterium RBG_16_68_21]